MGSEINSAMISRVSYYCQSIYTTANLYIELTELRKYSLLNELIIKIVEDTSSCITNYSKINGDVGIVEKINEDLNLVVCAYSNSDYFYIKDILEYELLKKVENIFDWIKILIEEKNNYESIDGCI